MPPSVGTRPYDRVVWTGRFGQGSSGVVVTGPGGSIGFTIATGRVSQLAVGDAAHVTNAENGC